jgi:K+-sensing histidine kinase KdpD
LVEDENRRIVETIALVRDVTERIEREEQLRQAKLAAEAALSACDVFVAHMGENLRQLLCDILEDTRLMLGRAGTSADLLERLNRIHNQTEHLYDQIGDILDLAHVEAGFDAVELSVFNLPHLLRRLEETLHLPAQQQGITLRFEGIDDLPILIRSDETKLKRILVNVIGDALKGTERGSVSVRALCLPDHVLRFEIAEPCKRGEHSAAGEASPYQSLGIDISARLVDVLCGQLEIVQTAEGVMITIVLPYVAVRNGSPSSDMPALPSQEQLGQLSEAWLQKMYAYCIAGQVEQAHAHVKALDPAQLDTAVQLSALIMLFHLDRIADAIEPLIDAE